MRKVVFAAVVLMGAAGVAQARAQSPIPLAVEGRVDAAFPMGEMDERAGSGVGFGAGAAVRVFRAVAVYASYSQTTFEFYDEEAVDEGFSAGVTVAIPGAGALQPWVGAGVVLHSLDLDFDVSNQSEDPGVEFGAGVAIPITPRIRITPAVGFRQWDTRYTFLVGGDVLVFEDFPMQYLTAGVGVSFAF